MLNDGVYDMIPNYIVVCFDLCDSGRQGGELIEPWEAWEEFPKCCVGFGYHSFGFHYGGGCGLALLLRVAQP